MAGINVAELSKNRQIELAIIKLAKVNTKQVPHFGVGFRMSRTVISSRSIVTKVGG